MWKKAEALIMTEEQRKTLEAWVRAKKTPQRIVLRSRICLLAAEGMSHNTIGKRLNTTRTTVLLWTNRFREQGFTGLSEDACASKEGKSERMPEANNSIDKARQLQRALYRAAKRSATRRFHALYDNIPLPLRRRVLRHCYRFSPCLPLPSPTSFRLGSLLSLTGQK